MAVFFNDETIACEECGSKLFYERVVSTLSVDPKSKELKTKYYGKDIVCAKCGKMYAKTNAIGTLQKED